MTDKELTSKTVYITRLASHLGQQSMTISENSYGRHGEYEFVLDRWGEVVCRSLSYPDGYWNRIDDADLSAAMQVWAKSLQHAVSLQEYLDNIEL